jgi:hypothetical protein
VLAVLLVAAAAVRFVHGVHEAGRYGFVDLPIFLAQARAFVEGGELYPDPHDPARYEPAAAVYKFPPLFGTLLLSHVGAGEGVLRGHWLGQIVLYLGAAVVLGRAGRARGAGFVATVAVLALCFEPFFETLWRLQLETPILALVAVAVACGRRGRERVTGAAVGVAAMLKVYPLLLLAPYAARRAGRVVAWAAVAGALVALATWIVLGPRENLVWYLEVFPRLLAEPPMAIRENVGLTRYLMDWAGLGADAARIVLRVFAAGGLAVSMWLVARARTHAESASIAVALFVPLMLAVMPNSWVNYQLLLLVPMVVLLHRAWTDPELRAPLAIAVGAAWALLLFYHPCAGLEKPWPCARTPHFLGIGPLPRAFHDSMGALRGLAAPLLWLGAAIVLARDAAAARARGRRRRDQASSKAAAVSNPDPRAVPVDAIEGNVR